jgi:putative PIN family toxin of toxin-antitoxin system
LRQAYHDGRFTLVTSEPLLTELEDVLARRRLVRKYQLDAQEVADLLKLLREEAVIVQVTGILRVCRDPDDDAVVETAIRGRAHVIVTGDTDLTDDPIVAALLDQAGIAAWSVRRFLREIGDEVR